jgi:hypothetical protein
MSALPRLEAYCAGLPRGLDSYPECKAKASGCREALARQALPPDAVPEALRPLVEAPPVVSAWISEVHSMAVGLAIADHQRMGDGEYLDFVYALNRELLGSPTYRYLMVGDSPEAMLRHASVRWDAMHRGVRFKVEDVTAHACVYRLGFPLHLYDELLLKGFARTFQASLDLCGAPSAQVTLRERSDTAASFDAAW